MTSTQGARKLTQCIARNYISILDGSFRATGFGDFKVRFGTSEYFASDLLDAIETARCMAGSHCRIDDANQYLVDMGCTPLSVTDATIYGDAGIVPTRDAVYIDMDGGTV
jgi:hypothetical protein